MNKKSFFGGLAIGLAGILAVGAMGWFKDLDMPEELKQRYEKNNHKDDKKE